MRNIVFPKTNVVRCVFSLRQNSMSVAGSAVYDEYDRAVSIEGLKKYMYRLPDSLVDEIQVGDFVVVHCKTGYQLCEIVEINVMAAESLVKDLAPVISKVSLNSYIAEIENKKALEVMFEQLEAEKQRLEKESIYDLLAEKNPAFGELLKKFREMGGKL